MATGRARRRAAFNVRRERISPSCAPMCEAADGNQTHRTPCTASRAAIICYGFSFRGDIANNSAGEAQRELFTSDAKYWSALPPRRSFQLSHGGLGAVIRREDRSFPLLALAPYIGDRR